MRGFKTWGLLVALAAANSAVAQTPDAPHLAAAHRVLNASGTINTMVAAMRANLPAQKAAMPQVPAEFWTRFEAQIVQRAPELVDSIAVVYARKFTVPELDAMTAFYNSAVGKRLRDLQPELVTESSQIGQRWGARIGAEVGSALPQ